MNTRDLNKDLTRSENRLHKHALERFAISLGCSWSSSRIVIIMNLNATFNSLIRRSVTASTPSPSNSQ